MMKETNENVTNCQTPPEELPCRGQHLPGVQPRQSASHCRHAHTKYYSPLTTSKYREFQNWELCYNGHTSPKTIRNEKIG